MKISRCSLDQMLTFMKKIFSTEKNTDKESFAQKMNLILGLITKQCLATVIYSVYTVGCSFNGGFRF